MNIRQLRKIRERKRVDKEEERRLLAVMTGPNAKALEEKLDGLDPEERAHVISHLRHGMDPEVLLRDPAEPTKSAKWKTLFFILWVIAVAVVVIGALFYVLYWLISLFIGATLGVMGQFVPLSVLQIAVGVSTLLVASILFRMRCRKPMLYGLVEIAVGILFAGYVVNHVLGYTLKEAGGYFTIAGAIYIIVRGYDNIYRSLKWGSPVLKFMNVAFFGRRVFRRL